MCETEVLLGSECGVGSIFGNLDRRRVRRSNLRVGLGISAVMDDVRLV